MTEILAPVYTPSGSWFSRLIAAIALAYRNYKIRRLEGSGGFESWIEDIDRLVARKERS